MYMKENETKAKLLKVTKEKGGLSNLISNNKQIFLSPCCEHADLSNKQFINFRLFF